MIKFLILSGIFGLTTYVGFAVSNLYLKKIALYQNLILFFRNIKNEIVFMKTDIISIFEKEKYDSQLNLILSSLKEKIKNDNAKDEINSALKKFKNLNEKDIELLNEFFYKFGKLSYDEQLASIEYYRNCFEEILKNETEKSKKMVPFYKKIGALVGLCICIVLL